MLMAVIWRRRSFDGVALGSFVAKVRGIRFPDFGVSGACRGESVVVGRRPDNVHDVWHSRCNRIF